MGLSQVLPVLQALFNKYRDTSTSHSILLIEQPELHLHPKMQSALLLEIWRALSGGRHWSQIVLETHSEAMLLRLQREVHDKRIPNTEVSILYVDSALSAVESESVRRLHLDSAGKFIDSWPESFSDLRVRDLGF
jgi:predicted ATPase